MFVQPQRISDDKYGYIDSNGTFVPFRRWVFFDTLVEYGHRGEDKMIIHVVVKYYDNTGDNSSLVPVGNILRVGDPTPLQIDNTTSVDSNGNYVDNDSPLKAGGEYDILNYAISHGANASDLIANGIKRADLYHRYDTN